MSTQQIKPFSILGIAVRTTNENGQSMKDIPALWNRFFSEGIAAKIPGKVDDAIYCVYTDYEGDYTKPYTTILGCKVESLAKAPSGLTGKTIEQGLYEKFTASGNLEQGLVYQLWMKIWDSPLDRAYTADIEVYGPKAKNPLSAEVDIFVAVK